MPQPSVDSAPQHRAALRTSVLNASKLTLAMAITVPLGFVTRILIPRYLGSEQAGVFFFAETFPSLLLMLLPMGISAYIQKSVPPNHAHAKEILRPIMLLQAVLAVVLTLGMLVFMQLTHYPEPIILLTGMMALVQALGLFHSNVVQMLFVATGRVNFVALMNVVAKVLLVLLVLAALLTGGNLYGLGAAYLVTQVIVLSLMLHRAKATGMAGGQVSKAGLKAMIQVSLPFFLAEFLASSNGSIDIALLSRLSGFREVGYYGAAQRLLGLFLILLPVISSALTPVLSRTFNRSFSEYQALASAATRALIVAALPLSLAITAFGREIIWWIYGAEFAPATKVMAVNGPLLLFSYLAVFLVQNIVIMTNGRRMAVVLACGFALNAALDLYLIPLGAKLWGSGGAACGSTVATLVVEMTTVGLLIKLSHRAIFTRRTIWTFVFAALPTLLCLPFVHLWYEWSLPLRLGLFIVVVPAYLWLTQMLTKADIALVVGLISRRNQPVPSPEQKL